MNVTSIKLRRLNLGFSVDDMVLSLGISKSMFYQVEQGYKNPSPKLIAKLAKQYSCSVDDIFNDLKIL